MSFARSSDIMSDTAAPSVKGEELPAVTVPKGLTKTGLRFESFSRLVSERKVLSCFSALNAGGTAVGIMPSSR